MGRNRNEDENRQNYNPHTGNGCKDYQKLPYSDRYVNNSYNTNVVKETEFIDKTNKRRNYDDRNNQFKRTEKSGNVLKSSEEMLFLMKLEDNQVEQSIAILEQTLYTTSFTVESQAKILHLLITIISRKPAREYDYNYFYGDRETPFDEQTSNLEIFGRAFALLETLTLFNTETDTQPMGSESVKKLIDLLNNKDLRIRTLAKRFIQELYKEYPELVNVIKIKLKNDLVSIIENQREPFGIGELIELTIYVMVSEGFIYIEEAECFFFECIFPILKIRNSNIYEQELKTAFESYSQLSNKCFITTITKLTKLFPNVNSNIKVIILNIVLDTIKVKENTIDFDEIECDIYKLISYALKSEHCIVLTTLLAFLKDSLIYEFLKKNYSKFIPFVFSDIYDLSKYYWNKDRSPEVYSILSVVMCLNKNVFEESLKKYNFKKYRQRIENNVSDEVMKYFGQDLLKPSEGLIGIRRRSRTNDKPNLNKIPKKEIP